MLGRGRRRGVQQQQQQPLNQYCGEDQCYLPTEEMPHRRKQPKSTSRRRSWVLVMSTFAFLLGVLQVAAWNQPENDGGGTPSSTNNAAVQRRHLREVPSSIIPVPKILVGIFTTLDDPTKDWHRQNLAQHPKQICALGDYESMSKSNAKEACQVIYTFVMGGNTDPNAPSELLTIPDGTENNSKAKHHSLLVTSSKGLPKDVNEKDCTLLNIRENEHQGKSQTFFYFASLLLKQEDEKAEAANDESATIDYVMKIDVQAKVNWSDFFEFAADQLSPAPYNTNTIGGALRDKAMWWGEFEATDEEFRKGQGYDGDIAKNVVKQRKLNKPPTKPHPSQMDRLESFWGNEFGGVHLYVDGQLYFMSADLCHFVANEALYAKSRIGFGGYLEGMEDHDISGMVWHAPSPIHMIPLTKSQRFWDYPVGPPSS